jgi:hypothetical protein
MCQIFGKDSDRPLHATLYTCQLWPLSRNTLFKNRYFYKKPRRRSLKVMNLIYAQPWNVKTCLHKETSHMSWVGYFLKWYRQDILFGGKNRVCFRFHGIFLCVLVYISTTGLFQCHRIARSTSSNQRRYKEHQDGGGKFRLPTVLHLHCWRLLY